MLFEHSGEVLWVFKAQLICCGGDASSADEQLLSLTHDKATNDVSRSIVRYLEEPSSLGEKPQAVILLVYLVREALCAVAVLSGCGGLDEPGAVCTILVIGVVEYVLMSMASPLACVLQQNLSIKCLWSFVVNECHTADRNSFL